MQLVSKRGVYLGSCTAFATFLSTDSILTQTPNLWLPLFYSYQALTVCLLIITCKYTVFVFAFYPWQTLMLRPILHNTVGHT